MEKQEINTESRVVARKARITSMDDVGQLSKEELADRKLVHPGMSNKEFLNSFREIRTKILKHAGGSNFVVSVAAVTREAGCSFVAANLAAALALDKTKTALLIDCNLYQPNLHQLLDIDVDSGLLDYLADDRLDINDIIYATGIPRLRVIPLGNQIEVGAEYFGSERMLQLIDDLKRRYGDRYIVLDVPPIGLWAEARVLTELSDFSVIVVPYGKVNKKQLFAAIDAVGEEKLAGLIFNN